MTLAKAVQHAEVHHAKSAHREGNCVGCGGLTHSQWRKTHKIVCPPEWNLTEYEYRDLIRAARRDSAKAARRFGMGSVGSGAVGAAAMLLPLSADLSFAVSGAWVAASVWFAGITATVANRAVKDSRLESSRLDRMQPGRVRAYGWLPEDLLEIISGLCVVEAGDIDFEPDPDKRIERLRVAYDAVLAFDRARNETSDESLAGLLRQCPVQVDELVRAAMHLKGEYVLRSAATVATFYQQIVNHSVMPFGIAAPAEVPSHRALWAEAVRTHDEVIEAWTEIVSDPLEALTHSTLMDVTQPRTATFIEQYGRAQDLRAVHGTQMPSDEAVVREYQSCVRKTNAAWTEAVRHSQHVAFDWLPEDEADAARQAAKFLAFAADEAATVAERATAAEKAAGMLRKVHSFLLPPAAMHAVEAQIRRELPAAPALP